MIDILNNPKTKVTMRKIEGLAKYQFVFLKLTRMQEGLMGVIDTTQIQAWLCQHCVLVTLLTMYHRTGNVCYIVVTNPQLLSYPVRRKIKILPTCFQQSVFMSIGMYQVVLFMIDIHTNNSQHVHCVIQFLDLIWLKKYTHKNS